MEEKLLKKLDVLIEKLKTLADKFPNAQQQKGSNSVVNSEKALKKSSMSSDEINREKRRAEEAGKIYKKVLGLGFNPDITRKEAEIFRKELKVYDWLHVELAKTNLSMQALLDHFKSQEMAIKDEGDNSVGVLTADYFNSVIGDLSFSIVSSITDLRDWTHSLMKDSTKVLTDIYKYITNLKVTDKKDIDFNKVSKIFRKELDVLEQNRILGKIFTRLGVELELLKETKVLIRQLTSTLRNEVGKYIQKLCEKSTDYYREQKKANTVIKNSLDDNGTIDISTKSINFLMKSMQWNDYLKLSVFKYKSELFFFKVITQKLDELIGLQQEYASERSKKSSGDIFSKLGGAGNLLAFGLGMYFVIKSIAETSSIDFGAVLKTVIVVYAFVGMFNKLVSNKSNLDNISKNFAIFGFIILGLIIPILKTLSEFPLFDFLYAIGLMYVIVLGIEKTIGLIEKVSKNKDLKKTMTWFGIFTAIILFGIIPAITVLGELPFSTAFFGILNLGLLMVMLGYVLQLGNKFLKNQELKKLMTSFAIFSATILFAIIPTIKILAEMEYKTLWVALFNLSLLIVSIGGILKLANKFLDNKDLRQLMLSFAIFSATILFAIIPTMNVLYDMPMSKYIVSLLKLGFLMLVLGSLIIFINKNVESKDLIKMMLSFGLFGLIIAFIFIPLMNVVYEIPFGKFINGLIKLSVLLLTFAAVLKFTSKSMPSPMDLAKLFISLALTGLIVNFILVPMFEKLNEIYPTPYLKSTLMFMLVVGIIVGGLILLTKAPLGQMIIGLLVLVALSFAIGYLADNLLKLSKLDWKSVMTGLGTAIAAILLFGLFVAGIGFLVQFAAPFLIIGVITLVVLSYVIGLLSDAFLKFTEVDWTNAASSMADAAFSVLGLTIFLGLLGIVSLFMLPFLSLIPLVLESIKIAIEHLYVVFEIFDVIEWSYIRSIMTDSVMTMLGFTAFLFILGISSLLYAPFMAFVPSILESVEFAIGELYMVFEVFQVIEWNYIRSIITDANMTMLGFGAFMLMLGVFSTLFSVFVPVVYLVTNYLSLIIDNLSSTFDSLLLVNWSETLAIMPYAISTIFELMKFVGILSLMSTFFTPFIGVTYIAIKFLGIIIDILSKQLIKFKDIDSENLKEVGLGLKQLGIGMISFVAGLGAALAGSVLSTIGDFFGLDITKDIRKFENLNADNLIKVGESLEILGSGLLTFVKAIGERPNIVSNFFKADITDSIKKFEKLDISKLEPVAEVIKKLGDGISSILSLKTASFDELNAGMESFTSFIYSLVGNFQSLKESYDILDIYSIISGFNDLSNQIESNLFVEKMLAMSSSVDTFTESINKLTDSYKALKDIESEFNIENNSNVKSDNTELTNVIKTIHEAEMSLMKNQLDQLVTNGSILEEIRDNITNISSSGGKASANPMLAGNSANPKNSKSNFKTKDSYLNNLKLLNMTIT